MVALTAAAIASLAGAAINGGLSFAANQESQRQMESYRNALKGDEAYARQQEEYYKNIDPLQTKSGQALSSDVEGKLKQIDDASAGRDAVMGGSGHAAAASKKASSDLLAEYNRSLIRQHEQNIVPQLNFYRGQYAQARAEGRKADLDSANAKIKAASTAAQGMVNSATTFAGLDNNAANTGTGGAAADNGNGTRFGTIDVSDIGLGFENKGLTGNRVPEYVYYPTEVVTDTHPKGV